MRLLMRFEDLQVYQCLCDLHIDVFNSSYNWPKEVRYELGLQTHQSLNRYEKEISTTRPMKGPKIATEEGPIRSTVLQEGSRSSYRIPNDRGQTKFLNPEQLYLTP